MDLTNTKIILDINFQLQYQMLTIIYIALSVMKQVKHWYDMLLFMAVSTPMHLKNNAEIVLHLRLWLSMK